jgi:hypothetical protein
VAGQLGAIYKRKTSILSGTPFSVKLYHIPTQRRTATYKVASTDKPPLTFAPINRSLPFAADVGHVEHCVLHLSCNPWRFDTPVLFQNSIVSEQFGPEQRSAKNKKEPGGLITATARHKTRRTVCHPIAVKADVADL